MKKGDKKNDFFLRYFNTLKHQRNKQIIFVHCAGINHFNLSASC